MFSRCIATPPASWRIFGESEHSTLQRARSLQSHPEHLNPTCDFEAHHLLTWVVVVRRLRREKHDGQAGRRRGAAAQLPQGCGAPSPTSPLPGVRERRRGCDVEERQHREQKPDLRRETLTGFRW